jgi:predicted flap endonuclease-1-like 5' DNA nuclease
MASPLTRGERRLARLLLAATVVGSLWHTVERLRPPPLPLELIRGGLWEDDPAVQALHDPAGADVDWNDGSDEAGNGRSGESPVTPTPESPLDIERATTDDLVQLPGIGPVLAGRIVAWREARKSPWEVEDLLAVRGIGPATLARIGPLVTVGTRSHPRGPGGSAELPDSVREWR